jgi:PBP4 family serine-type D-alanyl-D-alanine carboxypeptidase
MSRLVLILIIAFSSSLLSGKNNGNIQSRIDEILRTIPSNTKYGVMVYNPITKDTLYKRNIFEPIKPASNTKLFTTGAAYSLLGGDYQLLTKFFTDDDNLSDGVINCNLYIKGFGHSLFTDRDMDAMVSQLVSMGIRKITGKVIGDDSYFDDMYHRRDWIEEETNDALPPVSAIVINRNRIQFNLEASSRVGGLINFNFTPYCSLIKVRVNARTARGRSGITILQNYSATGYEFVINGSLKRRSRMLYYSAEIKNPPLFAAFLLQDKLNRQGISVSQRPSKGETPENLREIVSRAITLRDLSKIINKHSDNFLAECLFKTVGAAFSHNQGNSFYATQAISDFLKRNSIYSEGTSINDGSGLSHSNRVTVGGIVNLLEKMYYNPLVFSDYYNSLSIAGTDGTLRNRMIGTAAESNFHGKTGTLNGVIALSGYLTIKGKQDLIVSIIFEYEKGSPYRYRFLEDRIITSLAQDNSIAQQGFPEEKNQ